MKDNIWVLVKAAFGFMVVFGLYKGCKELQRNCWTYKENQNRTSLIYSLRTSNETSGSFVLGIGSIGSRDYYIFYRKTEYGGLIREKIETSNCVLYESAGAPKIIETGTTGYRLSDGDTVSTTFSRNEYSSYQSIYIPKGTITERINININ